MTVAVTQRRRIQPARRLPAQLFAYFLITIIICVAALMITAGCIGVYDWLFPTERAKAERAMLANTTFRKFAVMCPTPAMTAEQLVQWHQYAQRKGYPAMPEAGPNCYDP